MNSTGIDFVRRALEIGAFKFGTFQLSCGRESPYLFDVGAFCSAELLSWLGSAYASVIGKDIARPQVVFGQALSGIAPAISLAQVLGVEWAFGRPKQKDHGLGGKVVGAPLKLKEVLLADDAITMGGALLQARKTVEEEEGIVLGAVVGFDRQERYAGLARGSAVRELREYHKIEVWAVSTFADLLNVAKADAKLSFILPHLLKYQQKYGGL